MVLATIAGAAATASAQVPTEHWTFDSDFISSGTGGSVGTAIGDGVSITAIASDVHKGAGALLIDNTDNTSPDYLDILYPVVPTGGSFTISMWYRFDPALGPNTQRNFHFETAPDDALGAGIRTDAADDMEWFVGGVFSDTNGPIVNPLEWNHIALVYDKSNTELFVFFHNGQPFRVNPIGIAAAFGALRSQADGMHIGNHRAGDGSRNWQGSIDDFAIWDVALGPTQVQALYDGTFNGTPIDPNNVAIEVPNDLETLIPVFNPNIIEQGWVLDEIIPFRGPCGLDIDETTNTLYVGRRFQGNERLPDPFNPTMTGLDGLYSITSTGTVTQIVGGDRVAGVRLSPDGQYVFWSEDFTGITGDGSVLRTNLSTLVTDDYTGFATGDSDPMNVAIVPNGFNGAAFGTDSFGAPFVAPGDVLSIDRGNGGFEELYVFNPDTDGPLVGTDGTNPNFDEILCFDGDSADGDGIAYDSITFNAPFINPTDVTIFNNRIYVCDEGLSIGGRIYEITGIDGVSLMPTTEIFRPVAIIPDETTGDLIVLDRQLSDGQTRVLRFNTTTWHATEIITGLGGFPSSSGNAGYGSVALTSDGNTLYVADEVSGLGRIYKFTRGGSNCPACTADWNGDSTVDFFDVLGFLGDFSSQAPCSDLNNDTAFDFFDVLGFLGQLGAGCP